MAEEMKVIELKAAATGRVSASGLAPVSRSIAALHGYNVPSPGHCVLRPATVIGRSKPTGKVCRLTTEDSDKLAWRVVGVQFA